MAQRTAEVVVGPAPGGYLGVEVVGSNRRALKDLRELIGRRLAACLPSGTYFTVKSDLPDTLPLVAVGEDFDADEPGGPVLETPAFRVTFGKMSWEGKDGFLTLSLGTAFNRFVWQTVPMPKEVMVNRHWKLGYLSKKLGARDEKHVLEIVNQLDEKVLEFTKSEVIMLTEDLEGKELPLRRMFEVSEHYLVWMTDDERTRVERSLGAQRERESRRGDQRRQIDQEREKAREFLRDLEVEGTLYETALEVLETEGTGPDDQPVVSELGAAFYPHGGAGASRKHSLRRPGVSWADEEHRKFMPSVYSTPAMERSLRGRGSRGAELGRASSNSEKRNLLNHMRGLKAPGAEKGEKGGGSDGSGWLWLDADKMNRMLDVVEPPDSDEGGWEVPADRSKLTGKAYLPRKMNLAASQLVGVWEQVMDQVERTMGDMLVDTNRVVDLDEGWLRAVLHMARGASKAGPLREKVLEELGVQLAAADAEEAAAERNKKENEEGELDDDDDEDELEESEMTNQTVVPGKEEVDPERKDKRPLPATPATPVNSKSPGDYESIHSQRRGRGRAAVLNLSVKPVTPGPVGRGRGGGGEQANLG